MIEDRSTARGRARGTRWRKIDELEDGKGVDAFADDVIDVQPEELQHQHEEGDEKGGDKRTDKGLDDQYIKLFEQAAKHRGCLIFRFLKMAFWPKIGRGASTHTMNAANLQLSTEERGW